eukprot:TRINITY_DN19967_c0_g1_i1.p1 TRINITY_DN19967_c0_g1~~TRINITY_DN19967_c0_g1_i1.p1  ORF type:complete len:372 (-),score=48.28 TRINITY_DN19967_c0_g1_i1:30-1100(-)
MAGIHSLAPCITCHSWNGDKTQVALCPNNNEVHIYKKEGSSLKQIAVLKEHTETVTSIDWGKNKNRILTSSQDRNAYVWNFLNGQWKPTLVILRITRAATFVKWSNNEEKFAVCSSSKIVSICYFEEENDWWVSKHIKKHKSTVLSVAWHPNNIFVATTSSDFKTRVFSAIIKGIDQRPQNTPFGARVPFGALLAEYPASSWVHCCDWSPSGNQLAFVAHDSTVQIADITTKQVAKVSTSNLPFRSCMFLNEGNLIAAGYDCNVSLFSGGNGSWKFVKNLDEGKSGAGPAATGTRAKFAMWNNKVDRGSTTNETKLNTKHQNSISYIRVSQGDAGAVREFTTTATDGKLVFWKSPA